MGEQGSAKGQAGGDEARAGLQRRAAVLHVQRDAIRAGCEAAFVQLRTAEPAEAEVHRAELQRLNAALAETVQRLAALP